MTIKKLSSEEIPQYLHRHPDWSLRDDNLFRALHFRDFAAAFGFMAQIAILADKAGHHPEWFNVYNRVDIWLSTHDAGGISERDFALAKQIDELLG